MRRESSSAFLRSSPASVLISSTPKIEHIAFSVTLSYLMLCRLRLVAKPWCVLKKMPQRGGGRKGFTAGKGNNAMTIAG
ncbi:hypothetical protein DK853_03050 [Klebsiella oxytoca]|nr:hypothetical protein CEQ13_16205 [Klebsiella oxytoca]RBA01076.1 hypothetical protein DK853_03050 [Klebsiella oxytoca]TXU98685.1 hypothetical protein D4M90_06865 [Klebsiella oxytoca]